MGIFRHAPAPQVITFGVAVLLPAGVGPAVPAGSTATAQVLAAQRPGVVLAQPRPMLPPASVAPVLDAPVHAPRSRASWPHQMAQRPLPATQWGIDDHDLLFDRLWPTIVPPTSWPHGSVATTAITARMLPSAAVFVPSSASRGVDPTRWPYMHAVARPSSAQFGISAVFLVSTALQLPQRPTWPHAIAAAARTLLTPAQASAVPQVLLALPMAAAWPHMAVARTAQACPALVPVLGSVPPLPVLQQVPAAPWSSASVQLRSRQPIETPPTYTWSQPVVPPRAQPWPHAATRLPPATASMWGQLASAVPAGLVQLVRAPATWSYPQAMPATGIATLVVAPAQLLAIAAPGQPAPPPWCYAQAAQTPRSAATMQQAQQYVAPTRVPLRVLTSWAQQVLQVLTRPRLTAGAPQVQIAPPPVRLPPPQAWPHARALVARILPAALPPAPPLLATVVQLASPSLRWPYAAAVIRLRLAGAIVPAAALVPNPGRTYIVEAEPRLYAVEAEDRVLRVSPGQGTTEMRNTWLMNRDATLDWTWDLAARGWLKTGDKIISHEITGDGVTLGAHSHTDTAITAFLTPAPGQAIGTVIYPRAFWVTQQGRRDGRVIQLKLTDRGWHEQ